MIAFLLKLWGLARPYRGRMLLGLLTGIVSGLIEPLMIATITVVYTVIFPAANAPALTDQLQWAPAWMQDWLNTVQSAVSTDVKAHPGAVLALAAVVPLVIFLRGLFSYLNVYFLQWAAIRTITDLRARLFEHLVGLSAGFFGKTSTGE